VKLVVIGGDAAGMSAASQARKRIGEGDLQIVVFERGHFTSYSACGIPYWIGGSVPDKDALIARSPDAHRKNGIDVRMRHDVVGIDLDRREVVAHDLAGGGEVRESFDHLVYAAGAVPVTPQWARARGAGVFGVQTLDDGAAIHAWLDREPKPRRAVVIGSGYVGVEMAEAMVKRGLDVTLLEKSGYPMSKTIDPDVGEMVQKAIHKLGIDIRTDAHVEGIEIGNGRVRAVVTPGGVLPADVVVLGLGVRPNTALADQAGLPLGKTGGVITDLRMRVAGTDGVWAAGDCVETRHRLTGQPVHVPLGTHANKQGRVAGINLGGGLRHLPGRHRHRGHQGVRARGRPDRAHRAGGGPGRLRVRDCLGGVDQPGRVLPGRGPDDGEAHRRAAYRCAARGADPRAGGGGQADRRAGRRGVEPDDGRGDDRARSQLRAAVRPGVGSRADRGPQGYGRCPCRTVMPVIVRCADHPR
jgi:NADPH-dependent 2,4-dienoyl-CoA reductase/sulfur reductase-like enzyme